MSGRVLDRIKNALIVLLLFCVVVLTLMALPPGVTQALHLPPVVMRLLDLPEVSSPVLFSGAQTAAAAQPLLISVRTQTGRCAAQRSFSKLDLLEERLAHYLSEGLRTANGAEAVTLSDFQDAMTRESAYFDYCALLPVSAVNAWLGVEEGQASGSARRFLLSERGNAVELYLLGDTCTKYQTAVSADAFSAELSELTPDGSFFLFEQDADVPADPLTLWEGGVTLPNAVAEIAVDETFASDAATLLSFNPYGSGVYTDADGSQIFTENDRSCSVGTDATILYTDAEQSGAGLSAAADTPGAKIEMARAIVSSLAALSPGDARLYLSACEVRSDGQTICRFRYVLDGVPVAPDAAEAVFRGTQLFSLRVSVRSCRAGVSRLAVLPLVQAAAIAEPGASLIAAYHDSGSGTLSADWIRS